MSALIEIPKIYNKSQRRDIGEAIINLIVSRTEDGLDLYGRPFSGYSKDYEKTGTVDLTLTGEMLSSIEVLSDGPGFIKIGWKSKDLNNRAEWQENPTGQKSKSPKRRFLGISQKDLNRILESI